MSAHFKQISRTIKSLAPADKLVFAGSLVVILGLFLPWFSINSISISSLHAEETRSTIAFTGITYIIGYLCYLFTLTALNTIDKKITISVAGGTFILFLLSLIFKEKGSDSNTIYKLLIGSGINLFTISIFLIFNITIIFGLDNIKFFKKIKKYVINLFVGIENIILLFIASMVYHRLAFEFTSANQNFGIYTSFIGAALIFYGGYLQMQASQKASVQEIFGQNGENLHGGIHLKPDLNIDKSETNQNNEQEKKENSQLSFADYE